MFRVGGSSRIPGAGTLILASVLALLSAAGDLSAERRASGTERWQGKEIRYELSGKVDSDIRFSKGAREFRITVIVDGRRRTVTLQDEDVDVDGEPLDVGSYASVELNAERDFLIVNLVTSRSWSASTSASADDQRTTDSSTTSRTETTRAESSGTATDFHSFGFTELNDMTIRSRLKGGRSVECSIAAGPDERVIRFDVDGGKNEGTIAITPGLVSVDGVAKTVDSSAQVLAIATKSSLSISADRREIWSRD